MYTYEFTIRGNLSQYLVILFRPRIRKGPEYDSHPKNSST